MSNAGSFAQWLTDQRTRTDGVGVLARELVGALALGYRCPTSSDPATWRRWLAETGAAPAAVDALDLALLEYQQDRVAR